MKSWTKIPDWILYSMHERQPIENLILILLARNIEAKGRDILSLGYIQTSLGISKRTVQRAIKSLCDAKILEKKETKSKISSYKMVVKSSQVAVTDASINGDKSSQDGGQKEPKKVSKVATVSQEILIITEGRERITNPSSPSPIPEEKTDPPPSVELGGSPEAQPGWREKTEEEAMAELEALFQSESLRQAANQEKARKKKEEEDRIGIIQKNTSVRRSPNAYLEDIIGEEKEEDLEEYLRHAF